MHITKLTYWDQQRREWPLRGKCASLTLANVQDSQQQQQAAFMPSAATNYIYLLGKIAAGFS